MTMNTDTTETLFAQVRALSLTDPRAAAELARTNSVAGEAMIDRLASDAYGEDAA